MRKLLTIVCLTLLTQLASAQEPVSLKLIRENQNELEVYADRDTQLIKKYFNVEEENILNEVKQLMYAKYKHLTYSELNVNEVESLASSLDERLSIVLPEEVMAQLKEDKTKHDYFTGKVYVESVK